MQFGAEVVAGEDRFGLARNSREMMVELWEGLGVERNTEILRCAQNDLLREQASAVERAENMFDRPVDGLGAVYGDGGAGR